MSTRFEACDASMTAVSVVGPGTVIDPGGDPEVVLEDGIFAVVFEYDEVFYMTGTVAELRKKLGGVLAGLEHPDALVVEPSFRCDECEEMIHGPDGQSTDHDPSCSLHPDNEVTFDARNSREESYDDFLARGGDPSDWCDPDCAHWTATLELVTDSDGFLYFLLDGGEHLDVTRPQVDALTAAGVIQPAPGADRYTASVEAVEAALDCNTCGGTGRWETTLEETPNTLTDLGPCPDCQLGVPLKAAELVARKEAGGDCTQDESAWILGYFDAYHPKTTREGVAMAAAYPLEHDQWATEFRNGDRPNDTGRRIIAWLAQNQPQPRR